MQAQVQAQGLLVARAIVCVKGDAHWCKSAKTHNCRIGTFRQGCVAPESRRLPAGLRGMQAHSSSSVRERTRLYPYGPTGHAVAVPWQG